MGIFHNVFGDHDTEIQIVSDKADGAFGIATSASDKANEAFGIATSVSDKVTTVSGDVIDLSDRVTALSDRLTEFTKTEFSEQALQTAEMAGNANIEWIVAAAVFITFLVCTAFFTALCAHQGAKHEREENQNLPPETDMSSSRTSSVSNLTLEAQV